MEEYDCPTCADSFPTVKGRNSHHTMVHGKSIRGHKYQCKICGESFTDNRSPEHSHPPKYCGMGCRGKAMEGSDNPNKTEERREKISQGLLRAYSDGRKEVGHRKDIEVSETGHVVDSSWEAEVDRLLYSMGIDYQYNGRGDYRRYEIRDFTHAPDFILPTPDKDIVLEVKGGAAIYFQNEKMESIGEELAERDDVLYIIYGDVDLTCNYHIEYGNEEGLECLVSSLL